MTVNKQKVALCERCLAVNGGGGYLATPSDTPIHFSGVGHGWFRMTTRVSRC